MSHYQVQYNTNAYAVIYNSPYNNYNMRIHNHNQYPQTVNNGICYYSPVQYDAYNHMQYNNYSGARISNYRTSQGNFSPY